MRKGITVDHVSFWVDFTKFNVNMSGISELQCRVNRPLCPPQQ